MLRLRTKKIVGFVLSLIVVGLAARLVLSKSRGTGRVLWWKFYLQSMDVMNAAGFETSDATSFGPEEIPVPMSARLRELVPFRDRVRVPADEDEPTTLYFTTRRRGGTIRCLARYHEGYIAIIVLRYPHGLREDAIKLRSVLLAAFPNERIELQEDPPSK